MIAEVTIRTDASAAQLALASLKRLFADRRESVEAFLDTLDGYGELVSLTSTVVDGECHVRILPSAKLLNFLLAAEIDFA
jgi:hypothetical protein